MRKLYGDEFFRKLEQNKPQVGRSIIDPVTKRISEELYHPIGRLFADRYCSTRQRFNLPGTLPPGRR